MPVSDGYFSVYGDHNTAGAEEICPASFYCTGGVKIDCPPGYFCPTKGLSAPSECGDSTVFCILSRELMETHSSEEGVIHFV